MAGGGRRCAASSTPSSWTLQGAGGGAEEYVSDQEADLVTIYGEGNVDVDQNKIR